MSEIGLIGDNFPTIESDCEQYLSDLLNQNKIPHNIESQHLQNEDFFNSYEGYGYWIEECYRENFKRTVEKLKTAQKQASIKKYSEISRKLIELMKSDGKAFAMEISYSFAGNNTYADVPVFHAVDPGEFVQEWMGSSAEHWTSISKGLERRYENSRYKNSLTEEKKWLAEVIKLIDRQKSTASPIRSKRISRVISASMREFCKTI